MRWCVHPFCRILLSASTSSCDHGLRFFVFSFGGVDMGRGEGSKFILVNKRKTSDRIAIGQLFSTYPLLNGIWGNTVSFCNLGNGQVRIGCGLLNFSQHGFPPDISNLFQVVSMPINRMRQPKFQLKRIDTVVPGMSFFVVHFSVWKTGLTHPTNHCGRLLSEKFGNAIGCITTLRTLYSSDLEPSHPTSTSNLRSVKFSCNLCERNTPLAQTYQHPVVL